MPDLTFPVRENAPPSVVQAAKDDEAAFAKRLEGVGGDPWECSKELFLENKELRALLDLFEDYCEFRMGVKMATPASDIPTVRDMNRARKILGYNEIGVPKVGG